jgi:hypothetical protein
MRTAKLGQAGPSVGALGLGCIGVYATASLRSLRAHVTTPTQIAYLDSKTLS